MQFFRKHTAVLFMLECSVPMNYVKAAAHSENTVLTQTPMLRKCTWWVVHKNFFTNWAYCNKRAGHRGARGAREAGSVNCGVTVCVGGWPGVCWSKAGGRVPAYVSERSAAVCNESKTATKQVRMVEKRGNTVKVTGLFTARTCVCDPANQTLLLSPWILTVYERYSICITTLIAIVKKMRRSRYLSFPVASVTCNSWVRPWWQKGATVHIFSEVRKVKVRLSRTVDGFTIRLFDDENCKNAEFWDDKVTLLWQASQHTWIKED